jgi:hypothetical protein
MKKHLVIKLVCIMLVLFMNYDVSAAADYLAPRQEVLTGLGLSRIKEKGNYNLIPIFLDFNFDLKKVCKDIGISTPGIFDFVLEPELAYVYTPDRNAEIASNFLLKFGFLPATWRWQPYCKAGLGLIFLTQHIYGQSTQFNFNEYGGLGFHYFLNPEKALTLECRFRHLSNAGMKSPNTGINTVFVIIGAALRF